MQCNPENIYYENGISSVPYTLNNPQPMDFNTNYGYTPNEQPMPNSPVEQFQQELPSNQEIVQAPKSIQSDTENIRDYLLWSIINICLGGLSLGVLAVMCSRSTKERKKKLNIESAKRWSRATLGFNIFITFLFIGNIISVIYYPPIVYKTTRTY